MLGRIVREEGFLGELRLKKDVRVVHEKTENMVRRRLVFVVIVFSFCPCPSEQPFGMGEKKHSIGTVKILERVKAAVIPKEASKSVTLNLASKPIRKRPFI